MVPYYCYQAPRQFHGRAWVEVGELCIRDLPPYFDCDIQSAYRFRLIGSTSNSPVLTRPVTNIKCTSL